MGTPIMQEEIDRGVQLQAAGNLSEAETIYRDLLQREPNHPILLQLCGLIAHQKGDNETAAHLIKQAIEINPTYYTAHVNLCIVLKALGRKDEAVTQYKKALNLYQGSADVHYDLALLLETMERRDEAVAYYQKALEIQPNHLKAHIHLANIFYTANLYDAAIVCFRNALTINPEQSDLQIRLGNTLFELRHLDEAVDCFRKVLTHEPENKEALFALGKTYYALNQMEDAISIYLKAHELSPNSPGILNNLGNAYKNSGQLDEAENCYKRTLQLQPDHIYAHVNYADVLMQKGAFSDAVASLDTATLLDPENVAAHWNLSLAELLDGNFKRGWELYEWRWKFQDLPMFRWRHFPQPVWDGSDLQGKRILVWAEQGFGDELMFASLYPKLLQLGATCIFEIDARLVNIFQRSFPDAVVVARPKTLTPSEAGSKTGTYVAHPPEALESNIDFQCPAGSLMKHLMTSFDDASGHEGFLVADQDRTQQLHARYHKQQDIKVIGIGWSSPNRENAHVNAVPLDLFDSLLKTPGVQFISLQYGDHRAELDAAFARTGVEILHDGEIDPLKDADSFAAQVCAVDLVISNVNSTAIMAAALGGPVWGVLPHVSEWQRGNEGDYCLWYPTMQVFRQPSRGDWATVSERLKTRFIDWLGGM